MMNLNEMTSKELKELAKQHHIKNWWTMSKAALISALSMRELTAELEMQELTEIEEPEVIEVIEEQPATKELKKPNLRIQELTFEGRTQTIREWANELNMPWPTLYDRVNRNGWTTEEALTIPLGGRRNRK